MNASVVIPSYNSSERLRYNLLSLNYQEYPSSEFEVVVVDNGSKDDTYEMLNNFDSKYKMTIVRLVKNMGRAYARNIGVKNSKGNILIFHDSDMIVPPDYLNNHMLEHSSGDTAVCGMFWGRIYTYYYKNFNEIQKYHFNQSNKYYDIEQSALEGYEFYPLINEEQIMDRSFLRYGSKELNINPFKEVIEKYSEDLIGYNFPWKFFITNNCSAPKQNVIDAGMFDENFIAWGGEDYDLGYRLFKKGCKFKSRNNIVSLHQEHPTHVTEDDSQNSFYLCDKYNDIDMLLFLFSKNTSIKPETVNNIITDINSLSHIESLNELLHVYKLLLMIVRERARDYIFNKNLKAFEGKDEIRNYPDINIRSLRQKTQNVNRMLGRTCFIESLNLLMNDIFGFNLS